MVQRNDLEMIGNNIAKYRKLKNYTQKQLGDLLDVHYKTISKWENGNVAPDITIVHNIADVLDVSVAELLTGVKKNNRKNSRSVIYNVFIFFLLIVFATSTCYMYCNRWNVYDFTTNNENFLFKGYVLTNGEEHRMVISEAAYLNNDNLVISELSIEVILGNKQIYIYNKDDIGEIRLSEVIECFKHGFVIDDFSTDNNIVLKISYKNILDEIIINEVELNYE